jgi:hypothetical protein
MENKATLSLRNSETKVASFFSSSYDVYHCEYSFEKGMTGSGKIRTDVIGGKIKIVIAALPTDDLLSWAFDKQRRYDGEISLVRSQKENIDKVSFAEGRCSGMNIHFEAGRGDMSMVLTLVINARQMTVDSFEYQRK